MRVVVLGATGVIGRALLPRLAEEHQVVAVSRSRREPEDGVEWAQADAVSGAGLDDALEGADVAYHLVHSLGSRDYERQDRAASGNVSRAAAAGRASSRACATRRSPASSGCASSSRSS